MSTVLRRWYGGEISEVEKSLTGSNTEHSLALILGRVHNRQKTPSCVRTQRGKDGCKGSEVYAWEAIAGLAQ